MSFKIFLATAPGLENALYDEVPSKGFKRVKAIKGGVTIEGGGGLKYGAPTYGYAELHVSWHA